MDNGLWNEGAREEGQLGEVSTEGIKIRNALKVLDGNLHQNQFSYWMVGDRCPGFNILVLQLCPLLGKTFNLFSPSVSLRCKSEMDGLNVPCNIKVLRIQLFKTHFQEEKLLICSMVTEMTRMTRGHKKDLYILQ